ncbi:MAG: hypothetical protein K9L95_05235 [Candidatus Omnitrophica bacterium]|nr:hypothetical protein [Candidatus Omnitrophota bacterium]
MCFENPAELYNRSKRILFSLFHKYGEKRALSYLSALKTKMKFPAFVGLENEFFFYLREMKSLKLTVSLDCGDHNDFAGYFDNHPCRFDVTTNLDYKKFKNYEPFLKEGVRYCIALMDAKNNKLIDVINLAFPACPKCGGRLFDILILSTLEDLPDICDMQKIVSICENNPYEHYFFQQKSGDYFIHSFGTVSEGLMPQEEFKFDPVNMIYNSYNDYVQDGIKKYAISIVRFLKKVSNLNIVACSEENYFITDRDGGGYWGTQLYWRNPIISEFMDDSYDIIFESE